MYILFNKKITKGNITCIEKEFQSDLKLKSLPIYRSLLNCTIVSFILKILRRKILY